MFRQNKVNHKQTHGKK